MRRGVPGVVLWVCGFLITGWGWAQTNRWRAIGPEGTGIGSLAIDPRNPTTLYAGSYGGGVYKSTDGGATWSTINTDLLDTSVLTLAIDPTNTATLYLGTSGGVFKSTDGGALWIPMSSGLPFSQIVSLAVSPANPATLYAGTLGGVFKTTDGGADWTSTSLDVGNQAIFVLALDPTNAAIVYAGDNFGVLKTTDGGTSWNTTAIPPGVMQALVIDPTNPMTLYASNGEVWKTTNGGTSWTAAETGLSGGQSVLALAIDPTNPATLYAGTLTGIFKTTDGAATWTAIDAGLFGSFFRVVAVDPLHAATLYASTEQGSRPGAVFKSTDGGAGWAAIGSGLFDTGVGALAVAPVTPAVLYAGTSGGSGIYKTADGGASWAASGSGITYPGNLSSSILSLAIDASNPAKAYLGKGGGVFRTLDAGASWTSSSSGITDDTTFIRALAIDPSLPSTLYAGADDLGSTGGGGGVYKSTDGGVSWTAVNTGLGSSRIFALAIDSASSATLYAGGPDGIFKTTDGGASWHVADFGIDDAVLALAIDPTRSATLYAGTVRGVYETTDGGTSWALVGLLGLRIFALMIDSSNPATVYAGGAGFFRSTDRGASWSRFDAGLDNLLVTSLGRDPANATLYAGTAGNGVFALSFLPCVPGAATLCIDDQPGDRRFEIRVGYQTSQGGGLSGSGQAIPLASFGVDHGGLFWFFNADNPEMLIKVIDGCGVNHQFWVFASADTNVGLTTTVRDTRTDITRTYGNRDLNPAPPVQDTSAFACTSGARAAAAEGEAAFGAREDHGPGALRVLPTAPSGGCVPDATTLCIAGRFEVRVAFATSQGGGRSGMGQAIALSNVGVTRGGLFWFFGADNPEMLLKVIDACSLHGKYWVFYAAGTNVGLTVTVTDTRTGRSVVYKNQDLTVAPPVQDTAALPCN